MTQATCQATEEIVKLATDACQVQDACCNVFAVSGMLSRTMFALGQMEQSNGNDWVVQHPITIAILNKLEHLARMKKGRTGQSEGLSLCFDLKAGKDVTFEIIENEVY